MGTWSTFNYQNLRGRDEMCFCGEAVTVNHPRLKCILLSILHTIDHAAFLSRCICRDEEVIAVSTLRLPWRQRGFHCCALFPSDPVCARRRGIEALQELSALHSSAFYLAIESSRLMYDWIRAMCATDLTLTTRASAEETRTFGQHRSVGCICAFLLDWRKRTNWACCWW